MPSSPLWNRRLPAAGRRTPLLIREFRNKELQEEEKGLQKEAQALPSPVWLGWTLDPDDGWGWLRR